MTIRQEIEDSLAPYYEFGPNGHKEAVIDYVKSTAYTWPVLVELGRSGIIQKRFDRKPILYCHRFNEGISVHIVIPRGTTVKETLDKFEEIDEDFYFSPLQLTRAEGISLNREYEI